MDSVLFRIVFGSFSIALCVVYFVLLDLFPWITIYPATGMAGFAGFCGVMLLGSALLTHITRRYDTPPPPPYFVDDGRLLTLDSDGTYDVCQHLLRELEEVFAAEYSEHFEHGIRPDLDKERGDWNVNMCEQEFLVVRYRGLGLWIYGPRPPEDIPGFLRVAEHFGATEHVSLKQRVRRALSRHSRRP